MMFYLRVAALVLFILAIVLDLASPEHVKWFFALSAAGLACWVASTLRSPTA